MAKPLSPGLYVAATPIGNLQDVSDRLRQVLAEADLILCEDTRVTGKLLLALGLPKRPLKPYHEHNAAEARPDILARLEEGASIALVSDAGTPLISDPGYKIVREARDAGHAVMAVPGPSALTAALSIAGAPTDRFTFLGFLPKGPGQKRHLFEEFAARKETLVAYETGPRLASSLEAVAETLGPRRVAVARELTKLHEEVVEGDAETLAERYRDAPPKGEIVLVIHPGAEEKTSEADLDAILHELLSERSVKEAARMAADRTGLPKKDCYARALALQPPRS
ncbi:MAG: 16S rRNA (cytidine(1402)-2'-O)-methyltransferase [Parvularcula sp.]|jgi:16S rRNA (cytidine1402-2'-O)-methyltransferase|nr:16S rRNA (cytidine(1402)-2'-O)-methyltransferase [Parvularcula sp.]